MAATQVRPDGADRETIAERLRRDLLDCDSVESAELSHKGDFAKFEVSSSSLRSDVMRVLAEHDANLSHGCLHEGANVSTFHAHPPR